MKTLVETLVTIFTLISINGAAGESSGEIAVLV